MEDGREIFDDGEEDYEVQSTSNKRKGPQKKRGSKLPDEPVPKKKSLKNFFSAKDKKEKEATSVEDDDLLKNILGDLNTEEAGTSSVSSNIAPKPMRSIRKKATESEIETKKYMEQMGKTAKKNEADVSLSFAEYFQVFIIFYHNSQDILEDLLKEERKSKVKQLKNAPATSHVTFVEDHPSLEPQIELLPAPKDVKKEQEERELLEASMLVDEDDFAMENIQQAEKENIKKEVLAVVGQPTSVPKALSSRPMNFESSIFNELQGIDIDAEIRKETEGKIDWNQVSSS